MNSRFVFKLVKKSIYLNNFPVLTGKCLNETEIHMCTWSQIHRVVENKFPFPQPSVLLLVSVDLETFKPEEVKWTESGFPRLKEGVDLNCETNIKGIIMGLRVIADNNFMLYKVTHDLK